MLSRRDTPDSTRPIPAAFGVARRSLDAHLDVIAVEGELDLATAPQLKWTLIDLLDAGRTRLVLDLSRVSFMDSTALGVLVGVNRGLDPGARMAIVCGGEVSKVFDLSGVHDLFSTFSTLEQALSHVRKPAAVVGERRARIAGPPR
jgi:anti-sigma B factor antagonist